MKVLIFLIIVSWINSQTIKLIDAQSEKPIENANVFVGNKGITTDKYGLCNLNIFDETDEVTFSMIGYKTIKIAFSDIASFVDLK